MDRDNHTEIEHDPDGVVSRICRRGFSRQAEQIVEKSLPTAGVESAEETGESLGDLVLDICGVRIQRPILCVPLTQVRHQRILDEPKTLQVNQAGLSGAVDHFQGHMSYDLGVPWGFGEDGQADLPSRRVGAELVEVVVGLRFEGLVGGRVPADFYGACYLLQKHIWLVTAGGRRPLFAERGSIPGEGRGVFFQG